MRLGSRGSPLALTQVRLVAGTLARTMGELENAFPIQSFTTSGDRIQDRLLQEAGGKGLASLIDRALNADIPVVIAVSSERFADWVQFAGGMSVKLKCDRQALDAWWHAVSSRAAVRLDRSGTTVCEILK